MPNIIVGDLNIHYLEQGSGAPVVLVHGNSSSSVWWEYTLARVGRGYRFIAPDLRGRGDTEGPAGQWTVPMLADDLYGLTRALELEKAHLVGHSLGANVVLQYALDHRDSAASLLLLNPGWVAGDMPPEVGDESRIAMMVANKDLLKMALRGVAMMHPDDENWQRLLAASLKQRDEASLRGVAALKDWKVVDRLAELNGIVTTVVRGTGDQYLSTAAVCKPIIEGIAGARYHEIPGATHSPNVETPDLWVSLLLDHLKNA